MSASFIALRSGLRIPRSTFRRGLATVAGSGSKPVSSRLFVGAGLAIALPTYLYLNRALLDSQPDAVNSAVPDKVNAGKSQGGGGRRGGKTVSVRDVLDRKEGNEVWVVVKGEVYNVTEFLDDHPGGREIIESNRSKDVTFIFQPRHPGDQLEEENLPPNVHHLGRLNDEDATEDEKQELMLKFTKSEEEDRERIDRMRKEIDEKGLGGVVNMRDFERLAEPLVSGVGWAYYASGSDDEITMVENNKIFQKVQFRPRVMRTVREADASTKILGHDSAIPIYISPAAQAKLGHPLGEINLTRGAASTGIIQGISSYASCSLEEISAARTGSQPLFFQLYVSPDRKAAEDTVRKVNDLKMDAIFLTVDAPVGGKRERDLRKKDELEKEKEFTKGKEGTSGVSEALFSGVDPNLAWDDLKWLRSQTKLPILIKGVQTVEDAILAHKLGADGVVLSNHGGRQLDTTSTGLGTLLEIRKYAPYLLRPQFRVPTGVTRASLEHPENVTPPDPATEKPGRDFEIYVDGGVWRGSDAVKALCLGANAVGLGRGFLYAQAVGGEQGVEHAVGILKQEVLTTLRLLGVNRIDQLRPSLVDVKE